LLNGVVGLELLVSYSEKFMRVDSVTGEKVVYCWGRGVARLATIAEKNLTTAATKYQGGTKAS
jgi:hypothetical protein